MTGLNFLDIWLSKLLLAHASDLHVQPNAQPLIRQDGLIVPLPDCAPVDADTLNHLLHSMMGAAREALWLANGSLDIGYACAGQRFRLNLFRALGQTRLVARHIDSQIRSFAELGLPDSLFELSQLDAGLVLVTGATGSGKSTTIATLIDAINTERAVHILTIEDPVEFIHQSKAALITHRELFSDTPDFASAVRAALREDPDVILVGEMRDVDTMRAALTAAETGHLVLSTLHTADAAGAIERLVGAFPAEEQDAIRYRLSLSLKAVIAQQLLRRHAGQGRIAAVEILRVTPGVGNLIASGRTRQLYSAMESGGPQGMQTLESSLAKHVHSGAISNAQAQAAARDPAALTRLLAMHGRKAL